MASKTSLLMEPKRRKIQEILLSYKIAPAIARSVAMAEFRDWEPEQLSNSLRRLSNPAPDLHSFDFKNESMSSRMASLLIQNGKPYWAKPSLELIERSANEYLALCINAVGDWALLKEGYVAISHVWEEGIRPDVKNRGLPLPHIQQIFSRIRQTSAEWIWLDSLSIPGAGVELTLHEEELKTSLINNMANIYRQADAVIVFDALVMRLKSTDLVDVAISLLCGKWMTRVWTYQEILLAKKAFIITGNGFVEYKVMVRMLRTLSANTGHLSDILGDDSDDLSESCYSDINPAKYEEIYLAFGRLLTGDGNCPSLAALALSCYLRKAGHDLDYARAFFPTLNLTWTMTMTREEGMKLIYDSQRWYAKRLILMHGSPRSSFIPGWAPSYLTGLEGKPIGPEDDLGDIEWEKRGLKRMWYVYKVTKSQLIRAPSGLLLEINERNGSNIEAVCSLSDREREESISGFFTAVADGSAYMLSNTALTFPTKSGFGTNVMLVERDKDLPIDNEAWVYLTVAVHAVKQPLSPPPPTPWLLLHESPISTHDLSGKGYSRLARLLSDEKGLHISQNSLHAAAQNGDETGLRLLLTNGGEVESQDSKGWTPLHVASSSNNASTVRLLLQYRASVDSQDHIGRSPLIIAADGGHNQALEELLKNGADVNLSNKDTSSPLNRALMGDPLQLETVRILLKAGAHPNGQDAFGFAPLFIASRDLSLVELLVDAGADLNADLVGGQTVFHIAALHGNVPLIEYLLRTGIPVDLPEGSTVGRTALYLAVREQREEAVEVLLSQNANPNRRMDGTWTPFLLAAKVGNYQLMKAMLSHGADFRMTLQPDGWTALHIASREGHQQIVRLLLHAGVEANAVDASNSTALQMALRAGKC